MKTKKLSLEAYTALGLALLAQSNADAQVIIKDFDPDLRMMNWEDYNAIDDSLTIDIDSNGINDMVFHYYGSSGFKIVKADCRDAVTGFGSLSTGWYTFQFYESDTINELLNWENTELFINKGWEYFGSDSTCVTSYWPSFIHDNFAAIRLNFSGLTHYGWIRFSSKTLGNENYDICFDKTGSPLTVFSLAFNSNPDEAIIINSGSLPEGETIWEPALIDDIDANTISDLVFKFKAFTPLTDVYLADYSELRFYLAPSREDVIDFSVDEALALPETNFMRISVDSVLFNEYNYFHLSEGLLDITGNAYSPDTYYSGFYMKIPLAPDSILKSLSTPLDIVKAELQHCALNVNTIDMYYNDAGFFEVTFYADADDADISMYGAGVAEQWVFDDWGYYGIEWPEIDLTGIISIPKTEDSIYIKSLEGLTVDIYGNSIDSGELFSPVIFGFGDGYFRDLMCANYKFLNIEYPEVVIPESIINNNSKHIKIVQSNSTILTTHIQNFTSGNFALELRNITGELLIIENITSQTQTFSFPSLPDGIYIATIKENDAPVLVSKVILQK